MLADDDRYTEAAERVAAAHTPDPPRPPPDWTPPSRTPRERPLPGWSAAEMVEFDAAIDAIIAEQGVAAIWPGTRIRRRIGPAPSRMAMIGMVAAILGGILVGVLVVYVPIPSQVWRGIKGVLMAAFVLFALVAVWLPERPNLEMTPSWDGTEGDDGA